jgi:TP901 family phage tail tape measure protein
MAIGATMGMMFTAKDLASATITKVDSNLKGLAATSEGTAAIYNASMAKIRKGVVGLSIAVVGLMAMAKVTKTYGEFQHTLASAGVIMSATTGEMRGLERAAIDAGIATQFSPREAAEGLQQLGASGMNAATSIQVLNPVLDLAAASMGQLGVGGAAEVTAGVLNSFSMSADRASSVADKLVVIASKSAFQYRDFGIAISQAGAQASSADQSFESMLATLGMLRNTNLQASAAATAYREAVRKLSGDKRTQKELSKLSISSPSRYWTKRRIRYAISAPSWPSSLPSLRR